MTINTTITKILKTVCNYYGVTEENLKDSSKKSKFVIPRQMYCYFSVELTDKSLREIGELIKRDHATVLYSHTKIRIEQDIYKELKEDINEITSLFLNKIEVKDIDLLQLCVNYTNSFIIL